MDLSTLGLTEEQAKTVKALLEQTQTQAQTFNQEAISKAVELKQAEFDKILEGKKAEYENLLEASKVDFEAAKLDYETKSSEFATQLQESATKAETLEKEMSALKLESETNDFINSLEKKFVNSETKNYFTDQLNKAVAEGQDRQEVYNKLIEGREDIYATARPVTSVKAGENPSVSAPAFTREQIKNMSHEEINKNWTAIQSIINE